MPPDNLGFVTRFEIEDQMAEPYTPRIAGGLAHQELWVPADDLETFNAAIIGRIEVVARYRDRQRID